MNRRLIGYSIVVSLALTLLSIFFFDQPIAAFVQRGEGRSSVILQQGTSTQVTKTCCTPMVWVW
jgi:hypothetical protein